MYRELISMLNLKDPLQHIWLVNKYMSNPLCLTDNAVMNTFRETNIIEFFKYGMVNVCHVRLTRFMYWYYYGFYIEDPHILGTYVCKVLNEYIK